MIRKQPLPDGKTEVGFILRAKAGPKGRHTYRVDRAATAQNAAGHSAALVVTVK